MTQRGAPPPPPPATLTWTLDNVTFDDGGVASGTFDYDASRNLILDWNINVSGGDETTFPPFTYDPTTTEAHASTDLCVFNPCQDPKIALSLDFIIDPFAVSPPDTRVLVLTTDVLLTDSGGTVPLHITPGFRSRECFNCNPFRLVVTGSLVSIVP